MDAEIGQTYPTMTLTHRFLMNSTMERQIVRPPPPKQTTTKPRSEINKTFSQPRHLKGEDLSRVRSQVKRSVQTKAGRVVTQVGGAGCLGLCA